MVEERFSEVEERNLKVTFNIRQFPCSDPHLPTNRRLDSHLLCLLVKICFAGSLSYTQSLGCFKFEALRCAHLLEYHLDLKCEENILVDDLPGDEIKFKPSVGVRVSAWTGWLSKSCL